MASSFFSSFLQGFFLTLAVSIRHAEGLPFNLTSINNSLVKQRFSLTASYQPVYRYQYDDNTNDRITDGGKDMYDVGNQITVTENSTMAFENIEYNQTYQFPHAQLQTTAIIPFTALLKIDNEDAEPIFYTLRVSGRGSEDSSVYISRYRGNTSQGSFNIEFLAFQASGNMKPSICEIYYLIYSEQEWGSIPPAYFQGDFFSDAYNLNNSVSISGTPRRVLLGYSLFSRYPPSLLTKEQLFSTAFSLVSVLGSGNTLAAFPHTRGFMAMPGVIEEEGECQFGEADCDVNATCRGIPNRYKCFCKEGFFGDGYTCTDNRQAVDECALGTHNCHANATCINRPTLGGYKCACIAGYEGDGATCQDIDECATRTHKCHRNATCSNLDRGYDCTCNSGLRGDGILCGGYKTICLPDRMTFEVSSAYFAGLHVDLKDFFLTDYKCQGRAREGQPDVWVFEIDSFSCCGTYMTKNATHLLYHNSLENWVYTDAAQFISFSCSYEIDLKNLTFLSTHYGVVQNVANITAEEGKGQYMATLNRYSDASYTMVDLRDEYKTTDTLYIQIDLQTTNPNLNLVIDNCWVTPSTTSTDEFKYTFIESGATKNESVRLVYMVCTTYIFNSPCNFQLSSGWKGWTCSRLPLAKTTLLPDYTKYSMSTEITRSGSGPVAHFESKVIAFINYDTTYLHCSLKICSSDEEKSCTPDCIIMQAALPPKQRRKRHVRDDTNKDEVLSIGPLVIKKEGNTSFWNKENAVVLAVGGMVSICLSIAIVVWKLFFG